MAAAEINIFQILAVPFVIWGSVFGICKACCKFGWDDRLYDCLVQGKVFRASSIIAGLVLVLLLVVWAAIRLIEFAGIIPLAF